MKKRHLLLLFIVLKIVLQFFAIHPDFNLHRDEYLHLDLNSHFSWGYTSVPPFTAFLSWVIELFGNSIFAVKLIPLLAGLGTIVFAFKIIDQLDGDIYSYILCGTALTISSLLRFNSLYQPNSFDILFWTASIYFILAYINSNKKNYIYLLFITLAVGVLNKYTVLFLAIPFIPSFLISNQREVLKKKEFYYGLGLFLLIISPNIYWQLSNDLPVIRHMQELTETQLVNVNTVDFIIDQFLIFHNTLILSLIALALLAVHKGYNSYRVILYSYLGTLILFMYFHGKAYYMGAYYPALIAIGASFTKLIVRPKYKIGTSVFLTAFILALYLPAIDIFLPMHSPKYMVENQDVFNKFGLNRWEDGKVHQMPQDYSDMLGWEEVASIVDKAVEQIHKPDSLLIHAENYGLAGAINYYSKTDHPMVSSFNADYKYWYDLEDKNLDEMIFVNESQPLTENEIQFFHKYYEHIELVGSITNPYAKENGASVYIFKTPKLPIKEMLLEELEKELGY